MIKLKFSPINGKGGSYFRLPLATLAALLLLGRSATAQEIGHGQDWELSLGGFGTLGGVYSTNDDGGYVREISQLHGARGFGYDVDSRLGLQANAKLFDKIELVAQGVSRYRYNNSYDPELTMAFAKIEAFDGMAVRGGRLLLDVFMNTESRNIGYSYLTIRPPVEYFGQLFTNYFDGGDLNYSIPINDSMLSFKAYSGEFSEKIPVLGFSNTYDSWNSKALLFGTHLEYLWGDWQARINYANLRMGANIPLHDQELFPFLESLSFPEASVIKKQVTFKDNLFHYYSMALAWHPSPVSMDMALAIIDTDISIFPLRLTGFLTLGYRFDEVTPFISVSWTEAISSNRGARLPDAPFMPTELVNHSLESTEDSLAYNRHTISAGVRYDINSHIAAKFQMDFVEGSANGVLWEMIPGRNGFDGNSIVFGAALDFVF